MERAGITPQPPPGVPNSNTRPGGLNVNYIPAAALKRFANDLESDGTKTNRFLEINKERVQSFIEKPYAHLKSTTDFYRKKQEDHKSQVVLSKIIPGINDYSHLEESNSHLTRLQKKSFIHLQQSPEFQQALGIRSRFGEGDGSFFDRWLTSNVATSKHLYDKDGLPLMRFSLGDVHTGFKKHLNDYKNNVTDIKISERSLVKPYAQRRKERLERETKEKEERERLLAIERGEYVEEIIENNSYDDAIEEMKIIEPKNLSNKVASYDSNSPEIEITAVERDNYFGTEARNILFNYYQHLSRQRVTYGLDEINESPKNRKNMTKNDENKKKNEIALPNIDSKSLKTSDLASPAFSKPGDNFASKKTSQSSHFFNNSDSTSNTKPFTSKTRANEIEEVTNLLKHLNLPVASPVTEPNFLPSINNNLINNNRPISARTKYLTGCLENNILPQPTLIIRKELTTMLDLTSLGVGDDHAIVFSKSLPLLPALEGLSIANNSLSDRGIVAIISQLHLCKSLKFFDLSRNKVTDGTADALQSFLSSYGCRLKSLIMSNVELADHQVSKFLHAISEYNTLQELDLSHNKIGSYENRADSKESASESIAKVLLSSNCSITTLKLSWNMIHSKSAMVLAEALHYNNTLTYLDLSYNKLDAEASELLGLNLHYNNSLRVLKLAHNNISAKPAVILLSGAKSCPTLEEMDLSQNPIGNEGAKALLSFNLTHGHRVKVNVKNCSARIVDPSCWFDISNPKGSFILKLENPYDRAVAFEILRILSSQKNYNLVKFRYYSPVEDPKNEKTGMDINLKLFTIYQVEEEEVEEEDDRVITEEAVHKAAAMWNSSRKSQSFSEKLRSSFGGRASMHSSRKTSYFVSESIDPSKTPNKSKKSSFKSNKKINYKLFSVDMDKVRELFRETANRIFSQYDADNSGALDKEEIIEILVQLGLENPRSLVDKLMSIYDTDNSGRVEEEEFISFLVDVKKNHDMESNYLHSVRYMYNANEWSNQNQAQYEKYEDYIQKLMEFERNKESNEINDLVPVVPPPAPIPYDIPEIGYLSIVLEGKQNLLNDFSSVVSTEQINSLIDVSKGLTDGNVEFFNVALSSTKWTFNQVIPIFKIFLKEMGSIVLVLSKVLPQMSSTLDAQVLISHTTGYDYSIISQLKSILGGVLYRVYLGLCNGFHSINLSNSFDRLALERFIYLNDLAVIDRQKNNKGDTSTYGNWMICFKNVSFDGKKLILTNEWLKNLPDKGILEFDFIYTGPLPSLNENFTNAKPISNLRLYRILSCLGLINNTLRQRVFQRVQQYHEEGRQSSKGLGFKIWESTAKSSFIVAEYLDKMNESYNQQIIMPNSSALSAIFYNKRYCFYNALDSSTGPDEIYQDEKRIKRLRNFQALLSRQNHHSNASSRPQTSNLENRLNRENSSSNLETQDFDPPLSPMGRDGEHAFSDNYDESKSINFYGEHIKELQKDQSIDVETICLRLLDALEMLLIGRKLTCAQLSIIIDRFPLGNLLINPTSTFRVELIVSLFSNLVDPINFEYILKDLDALEIGMLIFRIGYLNVFSPMKPEGYYCLSLNRREERIIAKVLLLLKFIEKGENWQHASYKIAHHQHSLYSNLDSSQNFFSRDEYDEATRLILPPSVDKNADLDTNYKEILSSGGSSVKKDKDSKETWVVPTNWFTEAFPNTGSLFLNYYSGKGLGINNCKPNSSLRLSLCGLCYPETYEEDGVGSFGTSAAPLNIHSFSKKQLQRQTILRAEAVLKEVGIEYSFNN